MESTSIFKNTKDPPLGSTWVGTFGENTAYLQCMVQFADQVEVSVHTM
jgi:hypothetical protein